MKGNIMRTSIRSAAAIAAIATVGILGLTACSSSEETAPAPTPEVSSPAETPAAPPTPTPPPLPVESIPAEVVDPAESDPAVSEMVAPIVVDETASEVTAVIGDALDFVVGDPTTTTITVDNPAVLAIAQGGNDNEATMNPGATAVAEGIAVVTLTNADGTTRTVTVLVAAPDTATEETPVEAVPAEDSAAVTESAPAAE